jgi:hypothetical protein
MAKWLIEELGGAFDVTRDGRAFVYDCQDIEEARAKIKKSPKYEKGDTIFIQSEDGYREKLR